MRRGGRFYGLEINEAEEISFEDQRGDSRHRQDCGGGGAFGQEPKASPLSHRKPSFFLDAEGALRRGDGLFPTAGIDLLLRRNPNAPAQPPTIPYAGTDIYVKFKRATIPPFEPYFPLEAELPVIHHPANNVEGRA